MKKKVEVLDYYLDNFAIDPIRAHTVDAGLDLRSPGDLNKVVSFEEVASDRGNGGFGSTGK